MEESGVADRRILEHQKFESCQILQMCKGAVRNEISHEVH